MSAFRLALAALGGAALGGVCPLLAASLPHPLLTDRGFTPDLFALADSLPVTFFNAVAGAVAGGLIGLLHRKDALAALFILLANPAALWSFTGGAQSALFLAAALLVAGAVAGFMVARDYRALPTLALALAAAPMISASIISAYIPLIALALFSPWGLSAPKISGFLVVLWSPLLMCLTALALLGLLTAAPERPMSLDWRGAITGDFLTVAGGGVIIALSARRGTLLAAMLGFAAAAALLAVRFGRLGLSAGL